MPEGQLKLLTVLSALLLGVAVVWWLGDDTVDDVPWDARATQDVWSLESETVLGITLDGPHGAVRFERIERRWRVVEPFEHRADVLTMNAALDDLSEIGVGIPVPDVNPDDVGLGDAPRATLVVHTDAGDETLLIGDEAPVGYKTYVRRPDGPVVVVPGRLHSTLLIEPHRFRDRHLFEFRLVDVRALEIESPDGALRIYLEGGRWWLDGYGRANADRVDDTLMALLDLRFEGFLDQAIEQGMDDARFRATVFLADDTKQEVRVGGRLPMGMLVQTALGATGAVEAAPLRILAQGPMDLGDALAIPFDLLGSDAVDVELGALRARLTRAEAGWRSNGRDASHAAQALAELEVVFRAEPAPPVEAVWGRVEVQRGDQTASVLLGQLIDDGTHRAAQDAAGGSPYRVRVSELDELLRVLELAAE